MRTTLQTLWRREWFPIVSAFIAAAMVLLSTLAGAAFRAEAAPSSASLPIGPAYTTDRLNLRKGPALKYDVILVMPNQAQLRITGSPKNNFYPVVYKTRHGWAYGDYLRAGKVPSPPTLDSVQLEVKRTLIRNGMGTQWLTATRIISCESGWNPLSLHMDSNGRYSRGLWQINDVNSALWNGLSWKDPGDNTTVAIKLYRAAGNSWRPWSCYWAGSPPVSER